MMEVQDAILKRNSVRRFVSNKSIDDSVIKNILELGIRAPSAGNKQPWKIFVIRNPKTKRKLSEIAFGQDFIAVVPVVLIICINKRQAAARYGMRGVVLYSIQDTAALIENILLAVTDKKLGACWIGAFNEEQCSKALTLSDDMWPVAIIPIGYESGSSPRTDRKSLEEIVIWD